ncbi:MAG TPA: tetratricopeptide repeat protein [Candidatus Sulfomarinibacteraceae bacterium]|nr:tetratricopeptide repeat protein [Candidatus Sulfomarinibacteraceae bacterium]
MLQPRGLRPRRPSRWRTVILVGVHLVMAAHLAHWLVAGSTLSPVEPSEAMELAKHDVVNAGLLFFVIAILLTAVFGRFFCGWGCHLVALQDLSRWLLLKVGIRPRPLRSRLLGLVPLAAFAYMFLWPAAYRLATGDSFGPVKMKLVTTDFWGTFPGLVVALLTFAVCGFAVVYVLGAKGFCTFACPYGAAFGLADRLAPVRVRVTDACRGCAVCTAGCTSNVRVHEEVRNYGMVVDPGCMKCLDCVAGCPNGALYLGFGAPSLGRSRRKGQKRPPGSLPWADELLAAAVFAAAFVTFRGLYGQVPFLMSLGLAALLAGLAVAARRLIARPDAWLGPVRLKRGGLVTRPGTVFAVAMAPVVLLWGHSALVRGLSLDADAAYRELADLRRAALDLSAGLPAAADRPKVERARSAAQRLDRISPFTDGASELRTAWIAWLDGDPEEARRRVDRALRLDPGRAEGHLLAARILAGDGRTDDSARAFAAAVELEPGDAAGYLGWGVLLAGSGRLAEAREIFQRGVLAIPDAVDLRFNLGLALALAGDADGATRELGEVLGRSPDHTAARETLAGVLAAAGRYREAVPVFEEAVRRSPNDARLRVLAAQACLGAGDRPRAAEHLEAAIRLDPSLEPLRSSPD